MAVSPNYIIQRCTDLKNFWSTRAKKIEDWYDILLLVNTLAQEGMESVITNDPRTNFNLAKHLLTTMIIADKIPLENLVPEQVPAVSYLESYVSKRWQDQEKRYRSIGRRGWLSELFSWMLASGWYSVFSMVTDKEIWAEVWSPAECYPDFGPDGLVEHARIYSLSASAANRKIKSMGWTVPNSFTDNTTFYDHWSFDADGDVVNAVVAGTYFVKEPVKDIKMSKLGRLPIFTSPVGGLPDMGSIRREGVQAIKTWQEHFGESIVASGEDLLLNYNKMRTFLQQAARTAANPHYLELSGGDTPIATDALMNRWGSVLHGQTGEDVRPLQQSQIPVELTNLLFTYQNELQRTFFPYAVFGNIQQQLSYLAMANVASASLQVLTPYIDAFKGLRTDLDNFWADMILENGLRPYKFVVSGNMPPKDERLFDVDATVEIPGYLIQRATVSRMMNPNFKLPELWVMERMFPEIKNALKAQADTDAEEAGRNPRALLVKQILAYEEYARINRESEPPNSRAAELYAKLAKVLESELAGQPAQPQPKSRETNLAEEAILREVYPTKEATAPQEGPGQIA